jgi:peptidoglycan/xylan/chitin deacetylase (PgdA/CDA1 family)
LTFHTDGDLGLAEQLLGTLSARKAPITAFVVGQWLDANPTWAKRLVDGGHELANHTYTHPSFASLSAAAMAEEITRCRDVLTRLTGSGGRAFRPSGTGDGTQRPSDAVLAAAGDAGYPVVLGFDVDPLDYDQPGVDVVVARVLDRVKAGSIVSLHFGYPGTVAAVPKILDGLAQRQLTPVTASQLLGR